MSNPFGDDERKRLIDHINAKWKDPACPMCRVNNWQVNAYALIGLVPTIDTPMPALNAKQVTPTVTLICGNCGYTIFVNAFVAGVVAPSAK